MLQSETDIDRIDSSETDFLRKFEIAAVQKYANLVESVSICIKTNFLAKFGFDTAENEPAQKIQN